MWHCTPALALAQPIEHFFDAMEWHNARAQGLADKAKNERSIAEAEAIAKAAQS